MKSILLLLLVCSLTRNVQARDDNVESAFTIGVKAGGVLHSLLPGLMYKPVLSYQAGAICKLQIRKRNYLQAELLLTNMRYESFKNYYILVPLIFKAEVFLGLDLELGPQLNLNVYNNFGSTVFKTPDMGYCFGFSKDLGNMTYVNARYSKGLTPVFENKSIRSTLFALTIVHEF